MFGSFHIRIPNRVKILLNSSNWVYSRPRPFMRGLVQRVCSSVYLLLQLYNAGDSRFRSCVAARVLLCEQHIVKLGKNALLGC